MERKDRGDRQGQMPSLGQTAIIEQPAREGVDEQDDAKVYREIGRVIRERVELGHGVVEREGELSEHAVRLENA